MSPQDQSRDHERFQRLRELFLIASDLDPAKRETFIERSTQGDNDLRIELERLVRELDAPGFYSEVASSEDSSALLPIIEPTTQQQDPLIGKKLGKYLITDLVAHGGFSRIYEGTRCDKLFRQRLALKVTSVDSTESASRSRLESEISILAEVNHPNICRLYDAGMEDGVLYAVLEHVSAGRLLTFTDRVQASVHQKLNLFLELCEAVKFLHNRGLFHCDLKPSNVLVRQNGSLCLVDFGSARRMTSSQSAEGEQPYEITYAYASPELIATRTMSQMSEVYSLGMILYELLSGTYAYAPKRKYLHQLVEAIQYDDPPTPSTAVIRRVQRRLGNIRDVQGALMQMRGALDDVTLLALQKLPEDRYESVATLEAEIQAFMRGKQVRAISIMNEKRLIGMQLDHPVKAALIHSDEDAFVVRSLSDRLRAINVIPWLREDDILAGVHRQKAAEKGLDDADVVLVCLSQHCENPAGSFRREIELAFLRSQEMPKHDIFLIPVRFEECDIPDELRQLQWVNLYDDNGFNRLVTSLRFKAQQLKQSREQ